jgi:nitrile hydratase
MQGFGPVQVEPDEPVFHHDWERRIFGLNFASLAVNVEQFRSAIERMGATAYLGTSYYEHWLAAIEALVVERGVVSSDELEAARTTAAAGHPPLRQNDPERARQLVDAVTTPPQPDLDPGPIGFGPGDRVRVRAAVPASHTRCPRYVRGMPGIIEAIQGRFTLPDENVAGRQVSQPVYSVAFQARDLWGEGEHVVSLDLWESYLERRTR